MLSTSSSTSLLRSPSPHLRIRGEPFAPSPSSVRFRPPQIVSAAASCASAERTRSDCPCPPKLASSCASSLYEVLGIPMGASGHEIKAAYRKLARICHPDVAAAALRRKESSAADDFMRIHAAYSTLSDPDKRADYDRKLFRRHRPVSAYSGISASSAAAVSRFSGYTRRNWETDQCW